MYILSWILDIVVLISFIGVPMGLVLMTDDAVKTGLIIFVVSLLLIPICIFFNLSVYRSTEVTQQITVKSKERIAENKSGRYLIYTDQETFEDTDSLAYLKYNSSDLYGSLEAGKTYTCKIAGWRVQFFSSYRNLIECK